LERREEDEREETMMSDEFEKVSNKRSAGGKVG
jgi:hypothetical protein